MIYQWKGETRFWGDAQVVGERLEELANGDSRVTPDVVVSDARRKTSPLHPYFEWDDGKAAERYRLDQARDLLAAVFVVRDEVKEPVRAFINIKLDDDQAYRPIGRVLSNDELREKMLEMALNELASIKRRYGQLLELSNVFKSIDRIKVPKRRGASVGAAATTI